MAKIRLSKLGMVFKEEKKVRIVKMLVMCTYKLAAGGCLGGAGVIPQVVPPSRRVGFSPDQSILSLKANGREEGGSLLSWRQLRALRRRHPDVSTFYNLALLLSHSSFEKREDHARCTSLV